MQLCQRQRSLQRLDSIPRGMRIKQLNFQVKVGIIHLKPFHKAKANHPNRYVIPTLSAIDLIALQFTPVLTLMLPLKQRHVRSKRHTKKIMQIVIVV